MAEKLEKVKSLLGITDSLQDEVLTIIIDNITSHLKVKLGTPVSEDLEFIIVEIAVRRFNRIGTEGMQSESVEGHSISFYDLEKDFTPYEDIINKYKTDDGTSKGRVLFI